MENVFIIFTTVYINSTSTLSTELSFENGEWTDFWKKKKNLNLGYIVFEIPTGIPLDPSNRHLDT